MWKDIFVKRKYATLKLTKDNLTEKNEIIQMDEYDKNLFTKCPSCDQILINDEIFDNLHICPKCRHHFRVDSKDRISITFEKNSVEYFDNEIQSANPLKYPGYTEKIKELTSRLGINEGVLTGKARISNYEICFGVMDSNFIMGSMGSAVGEKLTRLFERAIDLNLPVIIFSVSGGARMQEGMLSLSQMAKVSAAVKQHSNKGLLYISILTDPTTGGVTASFASLGDIIIAEPKAVIGFAGKRVIEQTIKQILPKDFQSAEFMQEHGFIDMIVDREYMKKNLTNLLHLHVKGN